MQRKPSLRVLPASLSDRDIAAAESSTQPSAQSLVSAPVAKLNTPFGTFELQDRRLRLGESAAELSSLPEEGDGKDVSHEQESLVPVVSWGWAAAQGQRRTMEDTHIGVTDLESHTGASFQEPRSRSFFGLFDGHGGVSAAAFARDNLLGLVTGDKCFSARPGEALNSAFLALDEQFYTEVKEQRLPASGSTLLAVLVSGAQLLIANAGDSRAVLCRRGKALNLSRDHKPSNELERQRITSKGGRVCPDGFLNGQLGVSRGIGDYHLDGLKKKPSADQPLDGPLTAEAEISLFSLMAEDEFMVLACDGLWDVLPSQRAVELARQTLQRNNNDPGETAQMLVDTSLNMHASDNVTVMVVCLTSDAPPKRDFGSRATVGRSLSQNSLETLKSFLD